MWLGGKNENRTLIRTALRLVSAIFVFFGFVLILSIEFLLASNGLLIQTIV